MKSRKTLAMTLVVAVAVMAAAGLVANLPAVSQEEGAMSGAAQDGLFIHLSHGPDDPQRLLMGLQMANIMANDGKDVLVYCDIEAVNILTKEADRVEKMGFRSSEELLASLLENDVAVRACPSCMAVAGYSADDLREGVKLADKDEFFTFTEGRILTMDY